MALLLCLNQETTTGYKFRDTGITVYSFEEALYHFFHYWKESREDFLSEEFAYWVKNALNLREIAESLEDLKSISSFTERYISFLLTVEYFEPEELLPLQRRLEEVESKFQADNFKREGDERFLQRRFSMAAACYERSISIEKTEAALNNLGLSYLNQKKYPQAVQYLSEAYAERNSNEVLYNYIEALVLNKEYAKALALSSRALESSEKYAALSKIFAGEKNYAKAVEALNIAYKFSADDEHIYALMDLYRESGDAQAAIKAAERVKLKGEKYNVKLSELGVFPKSEEDLNADIHLNKAKFLREQDNYGAALAVIDRIDDPSNVKAELERALIFKLQGRLKDYQLELKNLLTRALRDYRIREEAEYLVYK
jgi:tetratricopeptide (TPR) repeat protein